MLVVPATTRRHVALRIPEHDLADIDRLAGHYGLTRTACMIRAATGELWRIPPTSTHGSTPYNGGPAAANSSRSATDAGRTAPRITCCSRCRNRNSVGRELPAGHGVSGHTGRVAPK
jgi:hypothetical protein